MRRPATTVSLVLVLTMGLASAARSERGLKPSAADEKAGLQAVLDNEWIEKLPYVTDLQPGPLVCCFGTKDERFVDYVIVVMTDTEEHQSLLERQVPGSLEGFRVLVSVDRSKEWDLEREKMMAKAQRVIDDPANKRFQRILHVIGLFPASVDTIYREPKTPAVGIAIEYGTSIKEMRNKVPKTIGGFPTSLGRMVSGFFYDCSNTQGCDRDENDDSDGN